MRILDKKGQGLTEYMILMVLVSLAAVGVSQSLGKSIKGAIRKAKNRIDTKIVFGDDRGGSKGGDDSDD